MKYQYVNISYREKVVRDDKGKQHTLKPLGGMISLNEEIGDSHPFLRKVLETNISVDRKLRESQDIFKENSFELVDDKGYGIEEKEEDFVDEPVGKKKKRGKQK